MTAGASVRASVRASCTPWSPARSPLLLRHPRLGREPEPGRPFEQARSPVWLRTHASRARSIKNTFSNIWFKSCWRGNRELSLRTGRLTMGTDDPRRLWTGRRRRWRTFALVAVQVAPHFCCLCCCCCYLFSSFWCSCFDRSARNVRNLGRSLKKEWRKMDENRGRRYEREGKRRSR